MFGNNIIANNIRDNNELNDLLNNLQSFNCNAFYRAYVVDNNDLDKLGRVKVRIPVLHGFNKNNPNFTEASALPWATPAIFHSGGNDSGSFIVPNIGDTVFVTFEAESTNFPIYFGGIPSKIGNKEKSISSADINNNEAYKYNDNDLIKEITNGTERVLYKSLKGATIIIDDFDGKEYIKIIDQAGQVISMENYGDSLDRRGKELGLSTKSKITLTNNQGDKVTLKNGKLYIQTDAINIDTKSIDSPGINRDFVSEAALIDIINGEHVVAYDNETDSNSITYQVVLDEIIGLNNYSAENKNTVNTAIALMNEISGENISKNTQSKYNDYIINEAYDMSKELNGEELPLEVSGIKYILNTYLNGTFNNTKIKEISKGAMLFESMLPTYSGYRLDLTRLRLPEIIDKEYQVINAYYIS